MLKIEYPASDGKPMTDKDINRLLMTNTEFALRNWFEADPEVYVSANLFLYYEEGDASRRVAPDVFVVKGVEKRLRERYLLWEEGRCPDVVFEFTSKSSRFDDPGAKLGLYAVLGVPEYYVFDPTGDYLKPRARAFRLQASLYQEIDWGSQQGDRNELYSPSLDLILRIQGQWLRLVNPETGEVLPTDDEALARAHNEASRARELEREVERLRRLLKDTGIDPD